MPDGFYLLTKTEYEDMKANSDGYIKLIGVIGEKLENGEDAELIQYLKDLLEI